jgi:tetratricopeptide (TPR) repeat protein
MQQLYTSNGVDLDLEIALFNADHDIDLSATLQQARAGYTRRPSTYAADVLAWALYKNNHHQEAQHYSAEALRLGAQDALKFFHAGMIAKALGQAGAAQDYLERAVQLNPHFSVLYAAQAQAALRDLSAVSRK